jgi:hypothetical protein
MRTSSQSSSEILEGGLRGLMVACGVSKNTYVVCGGKGGMGVWCVCAHVCVCVCVCVHVM